MADPGPFVLEEWLLTVPPPTCDGQTEQYRRNRAYLHWLQARGAYRQSQSLPRYPG